MACCCGAVTRRGRSRPVVSGAPGWAELWWTDFETAGRRPALVLTRPEAVTRLPRILVAPATTNIRGLPSEVMLDEHDGMTRQCVLNLDTPELVPRFAFIEFIAVLRPIRWPEICVGLETAVHCRP